MKPRYTDAFWGEHPFDGDMILIKKKNKNKLWVEGLSIVSKVSGLQDPRVKGFQGLNGFKGTKGPRASGFQGIEGFPMSTGAFKGFGVSKIQGFQGKYTKYELD